MSDWISVDDRLPDKNGTYLIKYEIWRYHSKTHEGTCREGFEYGLFDIDEGSLNGTHCRNITHWKPLED